MGSSPIASTSPAVSPFTLAGYVAGEGSFVITTRRPAFKDGTPRLRFVFQVSVATRDRPILEDLQTLLGHGSITDSVARNVRWQPISQFCVTSRRAHFAATIPWADAHLLPSAKRDQYELWRDALYSYDVVRPTQYGKGPSPCSVEGCERPVRGRGLCRRHYYRATGY